MAIVKAGIGEWAFNIGLPHQVGVAFFDAGGNCVDIQLFSINPAPFSSRAAALTAVANLAIAYAATQGATISASDVLSIY